MLSLLCTEKWLITWRSKPFLQILFRVSRRSMLTCEKCLLPYYQSLKQAPFCKCVLVCANLLMQMDAEFSDLGDRCSWQQIMNNNIGSLTGTWLEMASIKSSLTHSMELSSPHCKSSDNKDYQHPHTHSTKTEVKTLVCGYFFHLKQKLCKTKQRLVPWCFLSLPHIVQCWWAQDICRHPAI